MMVYEELSAELREQLQVESRKKFAELYEKACKVFGKKAHKGYRFSGFKNCWVEILEAWEKVSPGIVLALFYAAAYHLAWNGYPPANMDWKQKALIKQIEQAMVDEGYAYEMWSREPAFHSALDMVRETTMINSDISQCKSEWFGRYIYAKAYCRIGLKKRVPNTPFEGLRVEDVEMFATVERAREIPVVFEAAVQELLPNAVRWTPKQWSDEGFILSEIDRAHGTDYARYPGAFDEMIDLYDLKIKWKKRVEAPENVA